MSSPFTRPPRDETLSARLDDELPASQFDAVDAWLQAHPAGTARLHSWRADRDAIRSRFAGVLDEPVPARLSRTVWAGQADTHVPWRALAGVAAAVVVFAVGGVVGASVGWPAHWRDVMPAGAPSAANGWVQRAAVAHAVYTPEVRHPVDVAVQGRDAADSRAQEEHLTRWLTRRLDVPVKLFDLRAQGWELVGGRLLADAAGPSAQLMYQRMAAPGAAAAASAASGVPVAMPPRVTVYLRKPDAATPAAFRYEQQGKLGLFYWVEGPAGYALVGALPKAELLTLAESIYKQGATD